MCATDHSSESSSTPDSTRPPSCVPVAPSVGPHSIAVSPENVIPSRDVAGISRYTLIPFVGTVTDVVSSDDPSPIIPSALAFL